MVILLSSGRSTLRTALRPDIRWLVLIGIAVVICCAVSVPLIFMGSSDDDVIDLSHVQVPAPVELVGTPVLVRTLTHEAYERRRLAADNGSILTSTPSTVPASPTIALEELQRISYTSFDPGLAADGIPDPTPVEGWFDPGEGLTFYCDSGSDWTPETVSESNPCIVEGAAEIYAVTGVMRLGLVFRESPAGEFIAYLVPNPFGIPVVAGRLGLHGGDR